MKTNIVINQTCSCGKDYTNLPDRYLVTDKGDMMDGVWFTCNECKTTLLMPKSYMRPMDFEMCVKLSKITEDRFPSNA